MERLSPKQYSLLLGIKRKQYLSVDDALGSDQRTLSSCFVRQLVKIHTDFSFTLTGLGREAMEEYGHANYWRKNAAAPIAKAFGQSERTSRGRLRLVRRRAA